MNLHVVTAAALVAVALVSCGPSEAEIKAAKEKATADSLATAAAAEHSYTVDLTNSTVKWTGTMLGVKSHYGMVNLTEGSLSVKGGQVTAGSFTADLKTIAPQDTNFNEKSPKEGLIGHLSSADFFAVDSFPTASFVIKSVEGNTATGDLTVRGRTNSEKVTDIVVTEDAGTVKTTGKLVFDRQKYGVAFKAGKDVVLNDNIELEITLTGTQK
jgi:polyisoprenoid-binding protein YceI